MMTEREGPSCAMHQAHVTQIKLSNEAALIKNESRFAKFKFIQKDRFSVMFSCILRPGHNVYLPENKPGIPPTCMFYSAVHHIAALIGCRSAKTNQVGPDSYSLIKCPTIYPDIKVKKL